MKKLIFILFSVCIFNAVAQSTSPRFGTASNKDNTFRTLTNKLVTVTDASGADSVTLAPNGYNNIVVVNALDSLTFKSPTVTKCYLGDELTLVINGTSGDKVKFTGTNWVSAGTATLSSGLNAVIRFVFNGSKWIEASRVVQ
jgi:hypothetical protein